MSHCAWVAKVEDRETSQISIKHFRFLSFGSDNAAKAAFEKAFPIFKVLEVSTNPYKFKNERA